MVYFILLFGAPEKVFYLKFGCGVKKAALVAMTKLPALGSAYPSRGQCSTSASQTLGMRAAFLKGWKWFLWPLITSHFKTVI